MSIVGTTEARGVRDDLIVGTGDELWCAAGGFHVDPRRPPAGVSGGDDNPLGRTNDLAVITHAHGDHICAGFKKYLASPTCTPLLRARLGPSAVVESVPWGERVRIGGVQVSLHPAGHILGSAQVRVEGQSGDVWCVSGDYKASHVGHALGDATCEPFEAVRCRVFITESTFGLPIYRWKPTVQLAEEINAWWRHCRSHNRTAVVFAYALGKAQRVLSLLDESIGPIGTHGAVQRLVEVYKQTPLGGALPACERVNADNLRALRGKGIVVAPPSVDGSTWVSKLAKGCDGVETAMASGWMAVRGNRRRRAVDRGFVLSDHADWPGLLHAIGATGAERVGVTHGYAEPMARYLRERGTDSFTIRTRYSGEGEREGLDETDEGMSE